MIHRERFFKKAFDLGMVTTKRLHCAWIIPIKVVMVWEDDRIFICPNTGDALAFPAMHHLVAFAREDEVEAAFATYQLMNQGG